MHGKQIGVVTTLVLFTTGEACPALERFRTENLALPGQVHTHDEARPYSYANDLVQPDITPGAHAETFSRVVARK